VVEAAQRGRAQQGEQMSEDTLRKALKGLVELWREWDVHVEGSSVVSNRHADELEAALTAHPSEVEAGTFADGLEVATKHCPTAWHTARGYHLKCECGVKFDHPEDEEDHAYEAWKKHIRALPPQGRVSGLSGHSSGPQHVGGDRINSLVAAWREVAYDSNYHMEYKQGHAECADELEFLLDPAHAVRVPSGIAELNADHAVAIEEKPSTLVEKAPRSTKETK
jgi:hypothetical protein